MERGKATEDPVARHVARRGAGIVHPVVQEVGAHTKGVLGSLQQQFFPVSGRVRGSIPLAAIIRRL